VENPKKNDARLAQLFFYLQHPIIEPTPQIPAQHLVHRCSLGEK
jgi:hypothetical protein